MHYIEDETRLQWNIFYSCRVICDILKILEMLLFPFISENIYGFDTSPLIRLSATWVCRHRQCNLELTFFQEAYSTNKVQPLSPGIHRAS